MLVLGTHVNYIHARSLTRMIYALMYMANRLAGN